MSDQLENINKDIESTKKDQMEILELQSKMHQRVATVDINQQKTESVNLKQSDRDDAVQMTGEWNEENEQSLRGMCVTMKHTNRHT